MMNRKLKVRNAKAPNAILHMMRWGFNSGWILALLYLMFFWKAIWGGLDGIAGLAKEPLALLTNPLIWLGSFIVGAMPGTMLGMLEGFILRQLIQPVPIPFTRNDMKTIRAKVYAWIGLTTFAAGIFLTGLAFGFYWLSDFSLTLSSLIAGIAAAYAAHRYLFRLRLWSEQQYGIEKAKNVEHLEECSPHDIVLLDDEKEESYHETS